MKTTNLKYLLLLGVAGFFFSAFTAYQEKWEVPAKYLKMENPSDDDKESIEIGKQLYDKHCRSCHGKEGLGDGPKAGELETPTGDFTMEEFQAQSDGVIFYKTTMGRGDMPEFSKKIPDDEDRWLIVRYMRTFAE